MSNHMTANGDEQPFMASTNTQQALPSHPLHRGRILAVCSVLGGVLGFILMYLSISMTFNRAFLDLISSATAGMLNGNPNDVSFWELFVAALLLSCTGIVCGHWARRKARSQSIRTYALLGLWGGYLTIVLVVVLLFLMAWIMGNLD